MDQSKPRPMTGTREPTKEELQRVEDCMEAINAVLAEYKIQLLPLITLGPGGVVSATIQGMPIPEQSRILVPKLNSEKVTQRVVGGEKG